MRKRLIPPAIDSVFFQRKRPKDRGPAGTSDRPLRVLSVGRLEWKKGHEFALQMIEMLIRRGLSVEYRIVGEGEYLEAIAFCREQLKLRNSVHLLGRRTAEEVREQMEWADVFVHLAVSEGFCNSVLEAQSMELPVVASDADGLAENVVHEKTGFIVPRRDPYSAADRIFQLANDGTLRREMGQAGRLRVVQKFKLHDQIEAFASFYREIMTDGSPAYRFDKTSEAHLQGASEVKQ
jgi:colanic acid/amylovoran biosynthesis glycosyltransferase